LLAAVLTLLAFLFAGSTEPTREGTMTVTREAAMVFFAALPAFTWTFGLAGVGLLWAMRQRGVMFWLAAGAVAGMLVAIGIGLLTAGGIDPIQMVVMMVLGLVIFFLIRWIAGIRLS